MKKKLLTKDIVNAFKLDKGKFKERFNQSIAEAGILLEFEAEYKFTKKGFTFRDGNYLDKLPNKEEIARQIDIIASKDYDKTSPFEGFSLFPKLFILGDCKYTEKDNYFWITTSIQDKSFSNLFIKTPFFINGWTLNPYIYNSSIVATHFLKYFKRCIISRRIERCKSKGPKVSSNKEDTIFKICDSQIMPMLKYHLEHYSLYLTSSYRLMEANNRGIDRLISKAKGIKSWIESKYLLSGFVLPIYIFVPIIITNREIIHLKKINESFKIDEIEKLPFIMYLHSPINPEKYKSLIGNGWEFPIFVVNNNHLEEFIDFMDNGTIKLLNEIVENLKNNPTIIKNEIEEFNKSLVNKFNLI